MVNSVGEGLFFVRFLLRSRHASVLQHEKSPGLNYQRTFTLSESRKGSITSNTSHLLSSKDIVALKFLAIRA